MVAPSAKMQPDDRTKSLIVMAPASTLAAWMNWFEPWIFLQRPAFRLMRSRRLSRIPW